MESWIGFINNYRLNTITQQLAMNLRRSRDNTQARRTMYDCCFYAEIESLMYRMNYSSFLFDPISHICLLTLIISMSFLSSGMYQYILDFKGLEILYQFCTWFKCLDRSVIIKIERIQIKYTFYHIYLLIIEREGVQFSVADTDTIRHSSSLNVRDSILTSVIFRYFIKGFQDWL